VTQLKTRETELTALLNVDTPEGERETWDVLECDGTIQTA